MNRSERIFNFSAGPAILPEPVLREAQQAIWNLDGTGIGVLEHSHRGAAFQEILDDAIERCRRLADIPPEYHILFLQGGASTQFFMAPMNWLKPQDTADYLVTGSWSKKALAEARRFGNVHVVCSSEDRNFSYIPPRERWQFSERPVYVHVTSNNTIYGTQFHDWSGFPDDAVLICDASSDIFSRPLDVRRFGMIYAGAQKNLGPAGVTLVIVRDDLVQRGSEQLPTMLQYRTHVKANSCYNTPPTFGVFVMARVFHWIEQQGGLEAMAERNRRKAARLYEYLDQSRLFRPTAEKESRSWMNVTFVTGDPERDARFIEFARQAGLDGLKGHRSVGGMRASIYNAFPEEGVQRLIEVMRDFESREG